MPRILALPLVVGGCPDRSAPTPVEQAAGPPAEITNGEHAAACQWPSTAALINGEPYCSATLIHPRFVLTAAHCITIGGMPSVIGFGEDAFAPERSVPVAGCDIHPEFGAGVDVDLAVCELANAVDDVQPVPVLMGCEQDVLQPGSEVTIVGFGNTQSTFVDDVYWDGVGLGPKRYVAQEIHEVRAPEEEVDFLGIGVQSGGCHGDSGGGAFVKLADGTWRVFAVAQSLWNVPGFGTSGGAGGGGSTSGASTGVGFIDPSGAGEPIEVCGYGTTYSLVTPRMEWVESVIGEDVTPCFTTDGTWDPGEACTPFPTQIDQSVGTWAQGCAGAMGGDPQCGELDRGTETGTSTGDAESSSSGPGPVDPNTGTTMASTTGSNVDPTEAPGTVTDPVPATSGAETSDTDDPRASSGDNGCGCRHDRGPTTAVVFAMIVLLGLRRRA